MFFKTTWNRPLHAQSPRSTIRFSNCCADMMEVLKPIHRSYRGGRFQNKVYTKANTSCSKPCPSKMWLPYIIILTDLIKSKCLVETAVCCMCACIMWFRGRVCVCVFQKYCTCVLGLLEYNEVSNQLTLLVQSCITNSHVY